MSSSILTAGIRFCSASQSSTCFVYTARQLYKQQPSYTQIHKFLMNKEVMDKEVMDKEVTLKAFFI